MKKVINHIATWLLLVASPAIAAARNVYDRDFSLKLNAGIGLGNTISARNEIKGLTQSTHSGDYGIDLGWRFFNKLNNSLEVNMGVAFSPLTITLSIPSLSYSYAAPASADMDGNLYTRFYEIKEMEQKVIVPRITIPLYLTYKYMFDKYFGVYIDAGFRSGFPVSSAMSSSKGSSYSYGIYPEYDNLMIIDAEWLNDFGNTDLSTAVKEKPETSGFLFSILVGIGANIEIWGPLSATIGVRYDRSLTNIFNSQKVSSNGFSSYDAPVVYNVKNGQTVNSLTDYLKTSYLTQIGIKVALIYKF